MRVRDGARDVQLGPGVRNCTELRSRDEPDEHRRARNLRHRRRASRRDCRQASGADVVCSLTGWEWSPQGPARWSRRQEPACEASEALPARRWWRTLHHTADAGIIPPARSRPDAALLQLHDGTRRCRARQQAERGCRSGRFLLIIFRDEPHDGSPRTVTVRSLEAEAMSCAVIINCHCSAMAAAPIHKAGAHRSDGAARCWALQRRYSPATYAEHGSGEQGKDGFDEPAAFLQALGHRRQTN